MPPKFAFQSQMLANAIAASRSIVAAIEHAGTPDDALKNVIECQKSSIGVAELLASQFEAMNTSIDDNAMALTARVSLLENAVVAAASGQNKLSRKVLSESRCISSL